MYVAKTSAYFIYYFCKNKFSVKITESLSMHAKETNQIDWNPAKQNDKIKENVLKFIARRDRALAKGYRLYDIERKKIVQSRR